MDFDAIRSLGTKGISDATPGGESVRYEAEFEQLTNEIEKLTSVEQTPVKWRVVVELASGLLKDKGKDLLVASYLGAGLFDQRGYAGLAAAIDAINGLVDNFWEGCFPELRRLRARVNALEWLSARLEKVLETRGDPSPNDREDLQLCIAGLKKLAADANNRFGDNAPSVGPARRALQAKLDTIPEPEPEPEPTPEPAADAAPAAAAPAEAPAPAAPPPPPPPPPPEPEPADNPDTVREALGKYRKQQIEYATILREADDADPQGYLLLREAVWNNAALADLQGGSTGSAEFLAELDKDLEGGEYDRVLENAEKQLVDHALWLDLQLRTDQALEGLGRRYARVRNAIVGSLRFLLHRAPDLATQKNGKGEAFVSDAAHVWLKNEVLSDEHADEGNTNSAQVGKEARKLVARDKLGDAMRLMTQHIDMTASRRGRFLLRLDLAQLCIEAGRMELAVPQLEQLEQQVTQFSLEEWEPDLATSVVRWLWQCCAGPSPVASLAERSKDIYARLCRLDPAAAVSAPGPLGD